MFVLLMWLSFLALLLPWLFDWKHDPQGGLDYWASHSQYGLLAWLGFPIMAYALIGTLLFLFRFDRTDIGLTSLVFWTSLFAMLTGVSPMLHRRGIVYVYGRHKARLVGLLQFLIAVLMACLIVF